MTTGPYWASLIAGHPDLQCLHLGDHPFAERRGGLLANGNDHGQGHAALPRRSERRAGEVLDHEVEVGVGQDDGVVLGPAHGLDAFARSGAAPVDVVGDVRRADEADRRDARVVEDGIHRLDVAVHNVEHSRDLDPGLGARLHEQFGEVDGEARVLFGGLENEGVAAGDGHAEHPHRDHAGEVERGDAGPDTQRLAHGVDVDPRPGALGVFALQHVRDAAGELDHLQPALDVAARVGQHLAVLAGEHGRQLVHPRLDQPLECEHHPRAPLGVHRAPGRLRALRGLNRGVDVGDGGEVDAGLDGPGVGVEDIAEACGGPGLGAAVDEVEDVGHGISIKFEAALRPLRHAARGPRATSPVKRHRGGLELTYS